MTGGGRGFPNYSSVEVLYSGGAPWCRLPSLPDQRFQHTQAGLVTCGGDSSATSCLTFSGRAVIKPSRSFHSGRRMLLLEAFLNIPSSSFPIKNLEPLNQTKQAFKHSKMTWVVYRGLLQALSVNFVKFR